MRTAAAACRQRATWPARCNAHDGTRVTDIVRAIVMLGGALGKAVVAEGTETHAQLLQPHELGCEQGRGFHLSRPLTVHRVGNLLSFVTASQRESRAHLYDTSLMPLLRH